MNTNRIAAYAVAACLLAPVAVWAAGPSDDADSSHPTHWVKDSGITTAIKTKLAAEHLRSLKNIEVETEAGQRMAKQLAREEGILVGVSAGAALWACLEVARRLARDQHALIVTVFPDSGEKYLSERFWSEP